MFIQNGWRGYYIDVFEQLDAQMGSVDKLAVDYMLCFGQAVGQRYQQYISGKVVAMGALRNNRQLRFSGTVKGTIAFISQWRSEGLPAAGRMYSQEEFMGAIDRCIVSFLGEYAQGHGKRVHIIPRTQTGSPERADEAQYFSAMLGEPCHFLEFGAPGSSYRAVDVAEVVVGVDSTLVYESIARGTKTAVFSIRGTMMGVKGFDFGWPAECPSDGPFWTNTPSPERFGVVLDHLFAMTEDSWREELKRVSFDNLMIFDPSNAILKEVLAQALGV